MYRFDIEPSTIKVLLERQSAGMHMVSVVYIIFSGTAYIILLNFLGMQSTYSECIRWPVNTWHTEEDDKKLSLYSFRCDHPIFRHSFHRLFSSTVPTGRCEFKKLTEHEKKSADSIVVALYCIGVKWCGGSHHKTPYTNFVVTYFLHMKCVKWCH